MSFLQAIFSKMKLGLHGRRWMVEMAKCARGSGTEGSKPFTSACVCFPSLPLEPGSCPRVSTPPSMDQTQWLYKDSGVQDPVSRERLLRMVLYKSYQNAPSNSPS